MNNPVDWNPTFTKLQPPTATNLRIRSVHDAHKLFHAVYLDKLPMVVRRLDAEERKMIKSGDVHVWEERGPSTEGLGLGIERWTDGKLWGPSRVRDNFLFYHEKEREPADFHGGSKWAKMLSGGVVVFRRRSRGESTPGAYTGTLPTSLDANGNPMGMEMGVLHPNDQSTSSSHGDVSQGQEFNVCTKDRLVKQTYSVLVKLPKERGGVDVRKWHMTAYFAPNSSDPRPLMTTDDIPLLRGLNVPNDMYQPARVGRGMGRHRSTAGLDPTGTGLSRGVHIPIDTEEDQAPSSVKCDWDQSIGRDNGKPLGRFRDSRDIVAHLPSPTPSSSKITNVNGPPSLALASMPVVPSQPPSLGPALRSTPGCSTLGSDSLSIYNNSPPPPSPSTRSMMSFSTSESSGNRRSGPNRSSNRRYSPYTPTSQLSSMPPSPTIASPRTSSEGWRSKEPGTKSSTCGRVQLPPLSCATDRWSAPRRHFDSTPSSLPSVGRSRSSSLSEAASSITQLQTPQTMSPPTRILIGGSGAPSTTSISPPCPTKTHALVPLSFLKNVRSNQESQYSMPVPYGPGAVAARRAVDEEMLKGLGF